MVSWGQPTYFGHLTKKTKQIIAYEFLGYIGGLQVSSFIHVPSWTHQKHDERNLQTKYITKQENKIYVLEIGEVLAMKMARGVSFSNKPLSCIVSLKIRTMTYSLTIKGLWGSTYNLYALLFESSTSLEITLFENLCLWD